MSCVELPRRMVWKPPGILPLAGLIGILSPIFGKYVFINAWTVGLRSLLGMVTNLRPPLPLPSSIVLAAISCGVRVTPDGTAGLAESLSAEKSPVYSRGCGIVADAIWVGATA